MSAVDWETQVRLLLKLAHEFPEAVQGFTVTWCNEHASAGVYTHERGATVFLNNAEQEVSTLDEARWLLRQIFADELVVVSGYEKGGLAYTRLAPAADPAAVLPTPSTLTIVTGQRFVPDVDDIMIAGWSGVHDKG